MDTRTQRTLHVQTGTHAHKRTHAKTSRRERSTQRLRLRVLDREHCNVMPTMGRTMMTAPIIIDHGDDGEDEARRRGVHLFASADRAEGAAAAGAFGLHKGPDHIRATMARNTPASVSPTDGPRAQGAPCGPFPAKRKDGNQRCSNARDRSAEHSVITRYPERGTCSVTPCANEGVCVRACVGARCTLQHTQHTTGCKPTKGGQVCFGMSSSEAYRAVPIPVQTRQGHAQSQRRGEPRPKPGRRNCARRRLCRGDMLGARAGTVLLAERAHHLEPVRRTLLEAIRVGTALRGGALAIAGEQP